MAIIGDGGELWRILQWSNSLWVRKSTVNPEINETKIITLTCQTFDTQNFKDFFRRHSTKIYN